MTRKHDAALVALVGTTPLAGKFFPGLAPKGTVAPYAVFWAGLGTDDSDRESGPSLSQNPRWTIHCVGTTADQASWVYDQLKAVLMPNGRGVVPTVAGENPHPFWFQSPIPVQRDDDSTPPLFWHTVECGFESDLF